MIVLTLYTDPFSSLHKQEKAQTVSIETSVLCAQVCPGWLVLMLFQQWYNHSTQGGLIVDFSSCSMLIYHDETMRKCCRKQTATTVRTSATQRHMAPLDINQHSLPFSNSSHFRIRFCEMSTGLCCSISRGLLFWLHLLSSICLSVTSLTSFVLFYLVLLCRAVSAFIFFI